MAESQFLAVREDGAFVVAATAGDAIEKFLLPLALQRRDPQNLAGIEFERNVVEEGTTAQPAYFQRRLPIARRSVTGARRSHGGNRSGRFGPQHERDDPLLAAVRALGHTYSNAIAQHRRSVAQGRYLSHA